MLRKKRKYFPLTSAVSGYSCDPGEGVVIRLLPIQDVVITTGSSTVFETMLFYVVLFWTHFKGYLFSLHKMGFCVVLFCCCMHQVLFSTFNNWEGKSTVDLAIIFICSVHWAHYRTKSWQKLDMQFSLQFAPTFDSAVASCKQIICSKRPVIDFPGVLWMRNTAKKKRIIFVTFNSTDNVIRYSFISI